jgi:hypothetical protein
MYAQFTLSINIFKNFSSNVIVALVASPGRYSFEMTGLSMSNEDVLSIVPPQCRFNITTIFFFNIIESDCAFDPRPQFKNKE